MLAHSLSSPPSLSSIDPYSDDLPPITASPLLSRQPYFYHLDTSSEPPFAHTTSLSSISSPPLLTPAMSCAASYMSSLLSRPSPSHPSIVRSSSSVDSFHRIAHKSSVVISSPTQQLIRDWQHLSPHEERKEHDTPLAHDHIHEHKEMQQPQQRVREVSRRSRHSHQQWRRGRSKD